MSNALQAINSLDQTINSFKSRVDVKVNNVNTSTASIQATTNKIYDNIEKFKTQMLHGDEKQRAAMSRSSAASVAAADSMDSPPAAHGFDAARESAAVRVFTAAQEFTAKCESIPIRVFAAVTAAGSRCPRISQQGSGGRSHRRSRTGRGCRRAWRLSFRHKAGTQL